MPEEYETTQAERF